MGLADAAILSLVGTELLTAPLEHPAASLLAIWLLVSAYGLYRLRTWGLAAMALGNLAEVILALNGLLELPWAFIVALTLTAIVQVFLPVPIYGAMIRGRVPSAASPRWLSKVPAAVLIGFAVLSAAHWVRSLAAL